MPQSQSIIILSSSCTGDDIPSNDTLASPEASMSHHLSGSSSFNLQSLPIFCDILMLPELPDEANEALSLSKKRLNPCGIDNVLWMENFGQSAILMSLTSCHVEAGTNDTDHALLPIQPIPSTFVIDSHKEATSGLNPVPSLNVAFGFDLALRQWSEFLKVATKPSMTNDETQIMQEARMDGSTKAQESDSEDEAGCSMCKDSCDLTLEPFYQDLIRSSLAHGATTPKGAFGSDNPAMVLKHLQMMTEKEAQDLDRIMMFLGIVGVFLLGLLWWSGREMFRASRKEDMHTKTIQRAIQELEQDVHREKNRGNLASPPVETRSPRRALNFVTPLPRLQAAGVQPTMVQAPAPFQEATQDESSVCDTPSTVLLSQENVEDPFGVLGVSPVQKVDDFELQVETSVASEEDADDLSEETLPIQIEQNEQKEFGSNEESTPVLLLLTTSLSINRKHVVHQERMKTLLESNELDQVEIVDGADPSKKPLRNALFQLSGLRAVYPQLFVSRGSKLRFVGNMEKVQRLHDERLMTEKDLFNSKENDWQYLEDIISATPSIHESFGNHERVTSTSPEPSEPVLLPCASLPTSESQSTTTLVPNINTEDSFHESADSVSTAVQEDSFNTIQADRATGAKVRANNQDLLGEESMHSTVSASMPYLQTSLIASIQADSDSNGGGEDSIHSIESVLSARTPDASSASSSTTSLSPYAKLAKEFEERKLGRGKDGKSIRPKLKPLALQWNTGSTMVNKAGGQASAPKELQSTTIESSDSKAKLVSFIEQVPRVPLPTCKPRDKEEVFDTTAAPPSLEVTCSSPGSQDGASFIEDYWW